MNDHIQNEHGKTIQLCGKIGGKKSFKWKKNSQEKSHAKEQEKWEGGNLGEMGKKMDEPSIIYIYIYIYREREREREKR